MKKFLIITIVLFACSFVQGQKIKGPDYISYFQTPSIGVKFGKGDVFIKHDKKLEQAKLEAKQKKVSNVGSKFGNFGGAIANTVNSAMEMQLFVENAVNEFTDDKGRFAVWDFVPNYIIAKPEESNAVIVEIYVLNEEDPDPLVKMPTNKDKEGYYDVPYYINCRYKVTDPRGNVMMEENLGALSGTQKTKAYTPPPAPEGGITVTVEKKELSASERIGINIAYNRVRTEVYSKYGFGQFSAPIKLGVVKEIKESKKLIEPVLAIFKSKKGLLLTDADKEAVQKFADILEAGLDKTTEKSKWVALHNLSVCFAWLENPEKAIKYYEDYASEIAVALAKVEKMDLLLQGKIPKGENKGLFFVSGKDRKKCEQYNNIKCFVNNYPVAAKKYEKLLHTINRELAKFVDFYAHNDLLNQLFEVDYPFQYFPLQDFAGLPKSVTGTLTKEGTEPIDFKVKFDKDRRIKQLEASQITKLDDGSKEKLISRELKPQYFDNGNYYRMETDAGYFARSYVYPITYKKLNYTYDPLAAKTYGKATNITKKIGMLGNRSSNEGVQLKVDLDGNIYFAGASEYFKANAIFKDLLNSNGIEAKRADTKSTFFTKANINEEGVMTHWKWDGKVETDFARELSGRTQQAKANRMLREIQFIETDEKGNPKKLKYNFEMKGSFNIETKLSMKEFFVNYNNGNPQGSMNSEGFDFNISSEWDCEFTYDEQGNWTVMKVGPYTATRQFKY